MDKFFSIIKRLGISALMMAVAVAFSSTGYAGQTHSKKHEKDERFHKGGWKKKKGHHPGKGRKGYHKKDHHAKHHKGEHGGKKKHKGKAHGHHDKHHKGEQGKHKKPHNEHKAPKGHGESHAKTKHNHHH